MTLSILATPLNLSFQVFRPRGRINWQLVAGILITGALQAGLVASIAWANGAWHIGDSGKGFSQHYGAWAILITDPILLLASGLVHHQFRLAMATLPGCPQANGRKKIRDLLRRQLPFVRAQGYFALVFVLIVIVGVYAWITNITQTYNPIPTYHHQVFDSGKYLASFLAFKVCLFISWVIIYPIVGYQFISIALSTFIILHRATISNLICPIVTHPDSCYGLRNVGTLNVAILAPYILVFVAIFAVMATHDLIYGTLRVPLAAVSIAFFLTSFLVIWPVYALLRRSRDKAYASLLGKQGPGGLNRDVNGYEFAVERFHFNVANASPYSATARIILVGMRSLPVLIFVVKVLQQLHMLVWPR